MLTKFRKIQVHLEHYAFYFDTWRFWGGTFLHSLIWLWSHLCQFCLPIYVVRLYYQVHVVMPGNELPITSAQSVLRSVHISLIRYNRTEFAEYFYGHSDCARVLCLCLCFFLFILFLAGVTTSSHFFGSSISSHLTPTVSFIIVIINNDSFLSSL